MKFKFLQLQQATTKGSLSLKSNLTWIKILQTSCHVEVETSNLLHAAPILLYYITLDNGCHQAFYGVFEQLNDCNRLYYPIKKKRAYASLWVTCCSRWSDWSNMIHTYCDITNILQWVQTLCTVFTSWSHTYVQTSFLNVDRLNVTFNFLRSHHRLGVVWYAAQ